MGAEVTFDYALWIARYPEFATTVTQPMAQAYFDEATVYHANDGSGPVTSDTQQRALLNMLVAHIAAKNMLGADGLPASPFVGPITTASEGSVSVSSQPLQAPGSEGWYLTTRYGSDYWFATQQYRSMRYVTGYPRQFNPWQYRIYPGDT